MKIYESHDDINYIGNLVFEQLAKNIFDSRSTGVAIGKIISRWVNSETLWDGERKLANSEKVKKAFLESIASQLK